MKGIENIKKILAEHRDELRREHKIIDQRGNRYLLKSYREASSRLTESRRNSFAK